MMSSQIKCTFSVDTPVAPVTRKGSGRYATDHAVVFPLPVEGELRMVATEGHVLSVTRHEGKSDRAYLVPRDALPVAGTVELNGSWSTTSGKVKKKTFLTPVDEAPGCFPDVSSILPEVRKEDVFALKLDARLLAHLANALDEEGAVTLLVPRNAGEIAEKPIPVVGSEGVGLICPLSHKDNTELECCVHKFVVERYYVQDCWDQASKQIVVPEVK